MKQCLERPKWRKAVTTTFSRPDVFPQIWASMTTDRLMSLLEALRPRPHRTHITCTCPGCGQGRAFIYEPKDDKGPRLRCNRRNNCGYDQTLWEYVKGLHGGDGGAALAALAAETGVRLDAAPGGMQNPQVIRRARTAKLLSLPPVAARDDEAPPSAYRPIAEEFPALLGTPGADYMASRGICLGHCDAAGVRFDPDWFGRPAVVFPVHNRAGQEVAAQGRYIDGRGGLKTYTRGPKSLGVFATAGAWDAGALTITEAPIDALSLAVCGFPAIAILGSSYPDWLPKACAFRRVNAAFDADETGDGTTIRLIAEVEPYGADAGRLRPTDSKDWNEENLRLAECRRFVEKVFEQGRFVEDGRPHRTRSRAQMLEALSGTMDALTEACRAVGGPEATGYRTELDPWAATCLTELRSILVPCHGRTVRLI